MAGRGSIGAWIVVLLGLGTMLAGVVLAAQSVAVAPTFDSPGCDGAAIVVVFDRTTGDECRHAATRYTVPAFAAEVLGAAGLVAVAALRADDRWFRNRISTIEVNPVDGVVPLPAIANPATVDALRSYRRRSWALLAVGLIALIAGVTSIWLVAGPDPLVDRIGQEWLRSAIGVGPIAVLCGWLAFCNGAVVVFRVRRMSALLERLPWTLAEFDLLEGRPPFAVGRRNRRILLQVRGAGATGRVVIGWSCCAALRTGASSAWIVGDASTGMILAPAGGAPIYWGHRPVMTVRIRPMVSRR